ncbi:Tandem pore domain k+ channel [Mycena sanguinolenta]|uniref:Tandem pore domain k+ channel n=1 Tax=Mycena sanguinolenta TaxID=230812 RepID=A0A8H7CKK4_9AGAR|nr:Tandem pore domain k+ channel [Mycena sanguinolenta]
MAVLLPFLTIPRSNKPDPEKGEHPEASPEPDTRPPTEFDDLGNEYDEDDDLDTGPDPDDIRNDMEAERDETTEGPPPQERRRSYSSSFTLVAHDKPKPNWYRRLRDFISPKTTQEDLEAYVPNYRYTPILSGIVIPFSILLEIPGLTEHWYIRTVDNKIVENRSNPLILNIGLGLSMACALAANICLVARFLEKKVKVMTIGCYVINVIAVTTFGVEHRFNDGFTYGQSFWITVCSTIVSTFTNFTLITDLIRTPDFENSGSGLTRRQKSLVIIVILLLSYIALGALIYSFLLHLNFIDAMYFTLVSIETIGFGDIQPRTTGARLFTCIYAAFGIVGIALTVSLTRETVLEGLEVGYRKRVQLVRQRRKIGRWKRRVSVRWREAIEWRLRESGFPVWVRDANQAHNGLGRRIWDFLDRLIPWPTGNNPSFSYGSGFMLGHGLGYGNHPHGMHLNLEALSWNQLEAAAMEAGVPLDMLLPDGFRDKRSDSDSDGSSHQENRPVGPAPDADVPLTHARLGRMIAMLGSFALAVRSDPVITHHTPRVPNSAPIPQFRKSLTAQYDALRSGVEKEETKAFYARLVVVWALFIMFWTVRLYLCRQKGGVLECLCIFCFVAFTTIGYGDYSPQTPAGRSVFVAWALLGVATMTILISVISEAFSSHYHSILHAGIFQRAVKRYREQAHVLAEKTRRRSRSLSAPRLQSTNQSAEDILNEVHTRTQTQLETLPHKILADAKTFHEHLSYFVGANKNVNVNSTDELPPGIVHLMKEITGAQKIGERIKREILQDDDARHTLFTLAIEQALRKMINSAEDAIQALEERERLLQQRENEASQGDNQDESDNQDATPTQEVTSATFASTLLARDRGRYFPRWDTSTSSEYSDWR